MAVPSCEPLCQFGPRLYFTTFPNPLPNPQTLNVAGALPENAPRVRQRPGNGRMLSPDPTATYYYFTIDDQLLYLSFFQDWGPLNLAQVYKACILIHELLEDENLREQRLVLYSSNDPRRKANAALLMAFYVMIVQRRAPWEAFNPISELEFMPFRDAGRGPSDFNLNIQDCLWGMYKAMQNGLCDMNEFNVEDYEFYEKVENGDWNWITPGFIAFASPVETNWIKREKELGQSSPSRKAGASGDLALQRKLPTPFANCLDYFEKRNIQLVVRLNTELYDRSHFLDRGIDHMELYFDDGTNPTDEIVRKFIDVSDRVIEAGGVVAVHCKAGLGRTGTLIGAYLIWKYGFTANEAIAFMRIVRPGSVVGPQQQFMYLKQLEWSKWSAIDEMKRAQATAALAATLVTPATPPAEVDELDMLDEPTTPRAKSTVVAVSAAHPPVTPSRHVAAADAKAREIVPPGQPRKTPNGKRAIAAIGIDSDEEDENSDVLPSMTAPIARPRVKTRTGGASRGVTSSEARPTRVTRSTAGAANIKRTGAAAASNSLTTPASPTKSSNSTQPPNKIPRLAAPTPRSQAAAKAAATASKRVRAPSPTPSRLPTLIPAKRPHHVTTQSMAADVGGLKAGSKTTGPATGRDAWMANGAKAVVLPASKGDRPGLRSTRRRRSSFSSADVVA